MGLRTKRQTLIPGFPEYAGLFVLAAAVATGLLWGSELVSRRWIETPAEIVGVSLSEGEVGGNLRVVYKYKVKGQSYKGSWEGNRFSTTIAKASIPTGVLERLRDRGVISYIGTGADLSSVSLTEKGKRALLERGYTIEGLRDEALMGQLPAGAAEFGTDADLVAKWGGDATGSGDLATASLSHIETTAISDESPKSSLGEAYVGSWLQSAVKVRYRPDNPGLSVISYPGSALGLPYLVGFGLAAALTFGYFTGAYPALKRWGY